MIYSARGKAQYKGERMRLDDRIAVVTGAGRGLGELISVTLAKAGALVVLNVRPGGTFAEATEKAIRDVGGRYHTITADISHAAEAKALTDEVRKRFNRLDILVNNAGISADSLLLEMTEEQWDRVFDVNVRGAFNCIQAVAPHMIEQRAGSIINISSVVADLGSIGAANYVASKGAINSLTRSAAIELARFGIRVNAVAPGVVETKLMDRVLDKHRTRLLERIPMRRFAQPEEVAEVVLFLASDHSSYLTGEIIKVAGGMGLAH